MGASHTTLHKAPVCLDKLGVILEPLGGVYGRSEGRAALLAAAATPPYRLGHLALAERSVHPDGYGRERLRVGRVLYDRPYGDRERILLGAGDRTVLHISGALERVPLASSNGSQV
jgi:hypothetical protein